MAQVEQFLKEISQYRSATLDTNAVIYFLDGTAGFIDLLEPLFELVEQGQMKLNLSVITEAELLVKPYRENNKEVIKAVQFLAEDFPNIEVIPVTRRIAREAARIRSTLGLKLPDAIIIFTALESSSEVLIGNDQELLQKPVSQLPSVILSRYL
ncbi:MAG: PIN domain-containing protein [Pelotomaculum sp.]|uniref:Predicted nucleic acid-binding protein n=1 Tax=Pelotomaculum thermopropionicum (strain DSM 13744 / JCM 10971 / SI) TaxID=370438 RepID=A5CZ31_PELTS|nr:PIN domain-containing protein [Pelotomaculum sp.]BAF60741.1 predicted nucleic acid-binding protein [Pelotomaculum thermopropionicum SI]